MDFEWNNYSTYNGSGDEFVRAQEHQNFENMVRIIIPVVFGIITITGVLGNGLVIFALMTNKKMRTPTNVLILNLAVADFLFIVICVPFTGAAYVLPRWIFGTGWCKISQYFIFVSACVSIYSLVAMAVVRYLAITHPLATNSFLTTKLIYIVVTIVWVTVLLGFIPLLIQYDVLSYEHYGEKRSVCLNIEAMHDHNKSKMFYAMFFVFGYALPLYIMIMLYSAVVVTLNCGTRHVRLESRASLRTRGRSTKMVIAVVLCFLLCWMPIQVVFMIQHFGEWPATVQGVAFQMAANCLAYFNSCINPILYAFMSSKFRKSFKRALCCELRDGHTQSVERNHDTELVSDLV